jgi:hypothetical protein
LEGNKECIILALLNHAETHKLIAPQGIFNQKKFKMKTIGNLTHARTREFSGATFLNESNAADNILNQLLPDGWYPQDNADAWTDIAVMDGKYYACFGEDSTSASDAKMIYIEIQPTKEMKANYEYFKQY